MEFFRNPSIDWMGMKWYFIAVSVLLSTVGVFTLVVKGGARYGLDFRGGTQVHVKFQDTPSLDRMRTLLQERGLGSSTLQQYGPLEDNEILIGLDLVSTNEADLDAGRRTIVEALESEFGVTAGGKRNWNEVGSAETASQLSESSALFSAGFSLTQIEELAASLVAFRDSPERGGLVSSFAELQGVQGVTPEVIAGLEEKFAIAGFTIRNVEIVGPKVGAKLRRQAMNATLLGLASMLVYIAFRFEWIYGVAAVIAILHDVIIAVGFLAIFDYEISLTIIAALLTLVGFSVNDTIVIFDRIRENLKLRRRASIQEIATLSINQTLSRTVITSGTAFITVMTLFLFGGEVLRGFAFTLVVGFIVGSYSSIAVASNIIVSWQTYMNRGRKGIARPLERESGNPKAGVGAKP